MVKRYLKIQTKNQEAKPTARYSLRESQAPNLFRYLSSGTARRNGLDVDTRLYEVRSCSSAEENKQHSIFIFLMGIFVIDPPLPTPHTPALFPPVPLYPLPIPYPLLLTPNLPPNTLHPYKPPSSCFSTLPLPSPSPLFSYLISLSSSPVPPALPLSSSPPFPLAPPPLFPLFSSPLPSTSRLLSSFLYPVPLFLSSIASSPPFPYLSS